MATYRDDDWYEGCVNNRWWRLNHMYVIKTKEGKLTRFRMNCHQQEFFKKMWTRNQILKARQLGMSTFTEMFMFDSCLHIPYFEAGIIDKSLPDAEAKLSKIRLAAEWMLNPCELEDDPIADPEIRHKIACHCQAIARKLFLRNTKGPSAAESILAQKARFTNGSEIRIGTSLRGNTLQLLHVSEFGSIANNNPSKAIEILSGGVNAVASNRIVIMETTHEGGKYGENYRLMKEAMEAQGRKLMPLEYRFFFFPWWKQPEYQIPGEGHDSRMDDYFESLSRQGIELTEAQKRWYCVQDKIFGYRVRTEFPSTPDEAFTQQVEGALYGSIIGRLRSDGVIARDFEADTYAPLFVSWDIGLSDYMSLWLFQPGPDGKMYVLDYYSANDKPLSHYVRVCQGWEKEYRQLVQLHLLPHDAARRDFEGVSFEQKLYQAHFSTAVVPRTDNVWKGIFATKEFLPHCVFHRRCSQPIVVDGMEYMSGISALENYQVGRLGANGRESRQPLHDACSHGADAFRTFVEAYNCGYVSCYGKNWTRYHAAQVASALKKPVSSPGVPSCFQ